MERTRPSKGDHRRLARIDALVDRYGADRKGHRRVGKRRDAERSFLDRQAQRLPYLVMDGVARGLDIELHGAVEEAARIDAAEHEIGVGHHRIASSLAVTGRTGIRPRTLRADMDAPGLVDPCDGA